MCDTVVGRISSTLSYGYFFMFCFCKQKTAYEVRISDWSSDVCASDLLEYMLRNADRVVTRTMLLENVWHFHFDPQTTVVETHISRLRGKIEDRKSVV